MPAREEKRDTFRANFTDQDTDELLQRSFGRARLFGASKARIFSYWRVEVLERAYPYVRDRLAKAAAMLHEVPYPEGYREVRGLVVHMHLKDVREDPQSGTLGWAPVGSGLIDYRGQFKTLREDGYDRTISLETHYRRPDGNKVESTRESLEGLL